MTSMMGLFMHSKWLDFKFDFSNDSFSVSMGPHEALKPDEDAVILNFAFFYWSTVATFHIFVDYKIGIIGYVGGLGLLKVAQAFCDLGSDPTSFFYENTYPYVLGIHIFGWLTQFVGHGIYEQRAPAILTNLLFMYLAPFFVVFEIMNFFGYRQADVDKYSKIIEADIAHYRLSKGYPMRPGVEIKKD